MVVVESSNNWSTKMSAVNDTVSCIESKGGRSNCTNTYNRACDCCSSDDWSAIKSAINYTVCGIECQSTRTSYNMSWCTTNDWSAIISTINYTVSSIESQSGAHPSQL
jgi:hypothetical protein